MRIISGTYRGLRLKTLKGEALRPTSDQTRETLFDVLGDDVRGASFMDAYAGSGAVGIEALSRGARQVIFVENHPSAAELIRQNLRSVGVESGFRLLTCDVRRGMARVEKEGIRLDFVFLDPPYAEVGEYHHVLRRLGRSSSLGERSLVVAEHARQTRLEECYGALALARILRHGDSQLAFYRKHL
jgi:16S rRNA (guanine966-N2)-methyltransferase